MGTFRLFRLWLLQDRACFHSIGVRRHKYFQFQVLCYVVVFAPLFIGFCTDQSGLLKLLQVPQYCLGTYTKALGDLAYIVGPGGE